MQFSCNKNEFIKNLVFAEGITSSKKSMDILTNVLIETDSDIVKISSTDLDVGIKTQLPALVDEEGSITVHARKLLEIVRSFPDCELTFSLDATNSVSIYSRDEGIKAKFKIKGIPKDEYPKIADFMEENAFEIGQSVLKNMIKKTIISISKEGSRYYLSGVNFEKRNDDLRMVSTDGKRLSFFRYPEKFPANNFQVIVPEKVLNELLKILTDEGVCKVSISNSKNQIFFRIDHVEIVSSLLEGNFPAYEAVIPKVSEHKLVLDNFAATEAIKRVSSMSDAESKRIKLRLEKNKLEISSINPDMGEAKDEIDMDYDGESMEIGFNYEYLLTALKEIDNKKVLFEINSNREPMLIRGLDEENYLSIVMPMKLPEEE